ncbi:MAG TPA: sugar phosphate isomerase/epimerase family protein [Bryobacteraceae bacterium]|nr:sugar phosphate isomerase/epimerase family protein [Bryobacteraceae bacterium]
MTRRTLLASASAFAASAAAANRLPIKKGILTSMLPEKLTWKEKFQLAKDVGFEAIEGQTTEDTALETELRKASEATGMPIHSVMNMAHWQFPLSSSDPGAVEKSMKGMETSIRNAAAWGGTTVLLVPGVVNAQTGYGDAYKRSQIQIRKLIPWAEKNKIIIAVENVWNKFLLSPLEFAAYVDSFQSPYLKAYFDVGNIQLYGFPADWIRTLGKERIAKVHLKDFHNRRNALVRANVPEFVNLRDGDLDWKDIHKAFSEIGYKGYATVELRGGDEKYLRDLSNRVDLILNGE